MIKYKVQIAHCDEPHRELSPTLQFASALQITTYNLLNQTANREASSHLATKYRLMRSAVLTIESKQHFQSVYFEVHCLMYDAVCSKYYFFKLFADDVCEAKTWCDIIILSLLIKQIVSNSD